MQTNNAHSVEAAQDKAFVISADPQVSQQLQRILQNLGWQVEIGNKVDSLLRLAEQHVWSLVLIVEKSGCDLALEILHQLQPQILAERISVIVLSEYPSAVEAMNCLQHGARDYRSWPMLPSEIVELAEQVRRQFITLAEGSSSKFMRETNNATAKVLIGGSRPILELSRQLVKVAQAPDLPVFLNGETGTGKEVVAWQIHQLSKRPGSFRAINCAAMVESLLESELFGHERGAFTGAHATKKGLWEEAANGTIFLDEITEASPTMQAKLLRVLQEGTIRRVGSNHEIQVTARIIAASNRNLTQAVKDGTFREDLFYRLGQVLHIPPLRERVEDIPLLVSHFCQRAGKDTTITPEVMELLRRYAWPGNVRELESVVNKLIAFSGKRIFAEDVQPYLPLPQAKTSYLTRDFLFGLMKTYPPENWPTVQEIRTQYVIEAWHLFGRESQVARVLGMDYRTVITILQKANLLPQETEEPYTDEQMSSLS